MLELVNAPTLRHFSVSSYPEQAPSPPLVLVKLLFVMRFSIRNGLDLSSFKHNDQRLSVHASQVDADAFYRLEW